MNPIIGATIILQRVSRAGFPRSDSKIRHGLSRLMTIRIRLLSASSVSQFSRRIPPPINMSRNTGSAAPKTVQYSFITETFSASQTTEKREQLQKKICSMRTFLKTGCKQIAVLLQDHCKTSAKREKPIFTLRPLKRFSEDQSRIVVSFGKRFILRI